MKRFFKRFPTLVGAVVLTLIFALLQGFAQLAFLVEPLTFADGKPHPIGYVFVSTIVGVVVVVSVGMAVTGAFHLYQLARKIGRFLTEE